MKNLFEFLVKYGYFFLFLILEVISIVLICTQNNFQKSAVFSSCNSVAASLYTVSDNITNYFGLRDINNRLVNENTELRNQILFLQNKLDNYNESNYISADKNMTYIPARIIQLTTNKQHNYLTINRGKRDGILPDMGVINDEGVVGIVCSVSDHFALVIPLLNTDISISTKFQTHNYVGSLQWDGMDIRQAKLYDIARHVIVNNRDTLLTSGLSAIFPPDIPVGIVNNSTITDNDAFYDITVDFAVDFKRLNYVNIICNHLQDEQLSLQDSVIYE